MITIGYVQKPFGIKGELKVKVETDFVEERFKKGNKIFLNHEGQKQEYEIESSRMHQKSLLLKLKGLDDLNAVENMHRAEITISKDMRHELEEGEYYFTDLLNCNVYLDDKKIGVVKEMMDMPAHPVMRIKTNAEDVLVPFVKVFIKDVDLDLRRIDIHYMEGLF